MNNLQSDEMMFGRLNKALGKVATEVPKTSIGAVWVHASFRQLQGYEECHVNIDDLMGVFADYVAASRMQTAYLDWVFLDAVFYRSLHSLNQQISEDVVQFGDLGTWLPSVPRAFAQSSDAEKRSPVLLELKRALQLAALKLLPTAVFLALGVGCLFVDWKRAGWTILGIALIWRIIRTLRWILRTPKRRRAWRFLERLQLAYGLLGTSVVSTVELRKTVVEARDIIDNPLALGASLWAVLDYVCSKHPLLLVCSSPTPH